LNQNHKQAETGETKEKHPKHKSKKTQNKLPLVGEEPTCRTAEREGHAPSLGPPRQRTDAEKPDAAEHSQKKAEHGTHAHHKAESFQARGRHAPITDNRHDQSLQRKGRKTPGNMAGGRVVVRKRQRSVDLAFKIKENSEETGQKTPRRQHNYTPLLQKRNLEIKVPAKTKEITKKKKQATIVQKG
jgi:hypothetical protein